MRQWSVNIILSTGDNADGATVSRQIGELLDGSKYDVTQVWIDEQDPKTGDMIAAIGKENTSGE